MNDSDPRSGDSGSGDCLFSLKPVQASVEQMEFERVCCRGGRSGLFSWDSSQSPVQGCRSSANYIERGLSVPAATDERGMLYSCREPPCLELSLLTGIICSSLSHAFARYAFRLGADVSLPPSLRRVDLCVVDVMNRRHSHKKMHFSTTPYIHFGVLVELCPLSYCWYVSHCRLRSPPPAACRLVCARTSWARVSGRL